MKSIAWLALSLAIALVGTLFLSTKPFYWAGEIVAGPVKTFLGVAHIAISVLIAFRAGARQRN